MNKIYKIYKILYKRFGPQHWWPGDTPFEVMVGAILTQNTAWKNVEKAINNLKKRNLLSPNGIYNISIEETAEIIRPSGFFNIKAKRLKSFISFFMEKYGGDIEKMKIDNDMREKLLSISGIGKETADSILLYALNIPVFVIDAYTKRVFARHNIIKEDASYDEIQSIFMDALPKDVQIYNEYHALIVRLAKEYCRKKPLCDNCPLKEVPS